MSNKPKLPPYYPMYPTNFDGSTAGWTCEEVGIYVRLLNHEWLNGGLPDDEAQLARICRMSVKKFRGKWENVSTKFTKNGIGKLTNGKMEDVRRERMEYLEKQREFGKIGADRKRQKHGGGA